jgi:light-regulated signal transduction histidine kinase (bacteriophytochrome)
LLDEYGAQLDERGHAYLNRVRQATQRMGDLIDDLLELARVSRWVLQRQPVDLCEQAGEIVQALQAADSGRQLEFICAGTEPLIAHADPGLTRVVLENLMRNAWKFTRTRPLARIEFGRTVVDGETVYFFRDNGVGFDMAFAAKLFGNFQRLHAGSEFEGEGIGLAIVNRILRKHGGRIWAEGRPEEGATFYFTLGEREA